MREAYPEEYRRSIEISYRFSYGWRSIHNPDTNEEVADNLTTTEFTIAMLASRGWTNGEIAEYIDDMTVNRDIYRKCAEKGQQYVRENFDIHLIWEQIKQLLETGGDYEEFCDQTGKE